ncbi:inactive peptidyl-prolyl cis-trans isomerase FKBP6-like [Amphiura filiformis]|uniref:inactive peptidyl-prolyl cis-trans isomerase FKBP6-like n=1 Tax=Amphiura filiformis TaxID=82378 RepID=UPI003B21FD88
MDDPEPVENLPALETDESDVEVDEQELRRQEEYETSQHVKVIGEGVNMEELRKLDGKGTEFEVEYEVPEIEEPNYFDGEDLFQNLDHDMLLEQDSDGEDDGLTTFQRMAADMENVTEDGGVVRKVQKQGAGPVVPSGSSVTVHYNCYLEDIPEPYDSTRLRNKPKKFVLGRADVMPFLDIAVGTMRKGEITRFLVKPKYGFGEMGCPPRIPGNANIMAEIELIAFSEHVLTEEFQQWSDTKKKAQPFKRILKEVHVHREEGNAMYKNKQLQKAKHKYQKAERLLEDAHLADEEEEAEMKRVLLKVQLNLTLCYLKLKEPTRALMYSKKTLDIDPKNPKGLYRCGQAYYQCSDFPQAKKYFLQARRQAPNDTDIKNELAKLELSMKKFKMVESNMYSNMFPEWRDVKGDKVEPDGNSKAQSCSEEYKRLMAETIEAFKNNAEMQIMPLAVDIRTEEEIAFIKSAAQEMGLKVKAFSQSGNQDKYLKILKPSVEEE